MEVPGFVTHYYLPDRQPFLNLSDIQGELVLQVMRDLNALRRAGAHKRTFGRKYLEWRRLTETQLRESFCAAGGRPARATPHYFCLGHSAWFEGLASGMRSVSLPFEALPPEQTSFTLVDSFSAMGFGPQFGFPAASELHQQAVYPLADLPGVLRLHVPAEDTGGDYDGFQDKVVETYIEVQLWSDEPLRSLLGGK